MKIDQFLEELKDVDFFILNKDFYVFTDPLALWSVQDDKTTPFSSIEDLLGAKVGGKSLRAIVESLPTILIPTAKRGIPLYEFALNKTGPARSSPIPKALEGKQLSFSDPVTHAGIINSWRSRSERKQSATYEVDKRNNLLKFDSKDAKSARGRGGTTIIHIHGSGTGKNDGPSKNDLMAFASRKGVKRMVVVSPRGRTFVLTKGKNFNAPAVAKQLAKPTQPGPTKKDYPRNVRYLTMSMRKYGLETRTIETRRSHF